MSTYSTKHWKVLATKKKGHIHIKIKGPKGFRYQGLSSVKAELSKFEMSYVPLYFFQLAKAWGNGFRIDNVNYAEIFGSIWD